MNFGFATVCGEAKREVTWKNPSSVICEGKTQKQARCFGKWLKSPFIEESEGLQMQCY